MAKVRKLQRVNNLMKVIYNDGTFALAYPSGNALWYVGSGGDVPPDPGDNVPPGTFKYPFPRADYTTYNGHAGIDFPKGSGTNIHVIGAGTVAEVYSYSGNTYPGNSSEPVWRGNCIVVNHGVVGGDRIYSLYAHMLNAPSLNVGDKVTAGQVIGKIGNTGFSNGAHLHFEIDINNVRRPTGSVPSGADVTLAWMDANTNGSNW